MQVLKTSLVSSTNPFAKGPKRAKKSQKDYLVFQNWVSVSSTNPFPKGPERAKKGQKEPNRTKKITWFSKIECQCQAQIHFPNQWRKYCLHLLSQKRIWQQWIQFHHRCLIGVISECIFNIVSSSHKCTKSLTSTFH